MNYLTTTDLRTKSSELIDLLTKGMEVSLIHRSQIVGVIKPKKQPKVLTETKIGKLKKLALKLNLPKISYKERAKLYREHLLKKYGKGLS